MGIGYWMWPDLLTDANSKIEKWKKNKTHTHARARMFIWKIQGKLSCDTKIETRSRCKWDKNRWHLYTCHHSSISVESQDTTSENIGQITMNVKILVCKSPSLSVCVCVCVCVCARVFQSCQFTSVERHVNRVITFILLIHLQVDIGGSLCGSFVSPQGQR